MAIITEDYVSFETAKLLKEKGFNEPCECAYSEGGQYLLSCYNSIANRRVKNDEALDFSYSSTAPTLQMACKWLREVHGLFIYLEPCFDYELKHVVYLAFIQNVTDIGIFLEGRVEVTSGYIVEAVYDKALKYCLEYLI